MGERKGQNFYYPPDFNYKKHGNLNRYHGTHALRERASKIGQGILVIRFEMPFNIWCLGCQNHIGMGVRYNAEKKKIGMYYTTPLFEFRMKCHLCDNYLVIRNDPKNFDYELVEGCRRQEIRYDPATIDQLGAVDRTFNQKLAADAMFKTEHEHTDKTTAETNDSRLEKIEWVQGRMFDDFSANQALRNQFRREKTDLTEQRAKDDALRARTSLSIKLAPDDPNDKKLASMFTRYKTVKTFSEKQDEERDEITSRRIFRGPSSSKETGTNSSAERLLRNNLKLERNKKINCQFGANLGKRPSAVEIGIVRVKREKNEIDAVEPTEEKNVSINDTRQPLVQYGDSSDSD